MDGAIVASALWWYLALALFGLVGLVPAAALFERLSSRGVYFARPLGLATAALLTWLVVRLTDVPYGTPMVIASVATLGAMSLALLAWRRELLGALRSRWRPLLASEGITVAVFAVVLFARVGSPDAWGTEKPADLMLLNAVHSARELPPLDPWLAGERLSYYHLGQVEVDHVARLSGEPPERAFNLATAAVGAMAAAAVAGLAIDIVQLGGPRRRRTQLIAGGTAVAALLLVAPLVGLVQIASANGIGGEAAWGWLGIEDVPTKVGATNLVPDRFWWWWPTTRVIPGVISEYPGFSLVLGDPHPHLLALPLGIVAMALGVQVFEGSTPLSWRRWFTHPDHLVLTAAVFAGLVMTSSWDVITYGALWGVAAWWSACRTGWPFILGGFLAVRWALAPAVLALAFAWTFFDTLDPQPLGLAPVEGEYSDAGRWLLFWLPLLVPAIIGLAFTWRPSQRRLVDAATFVVLPIGLWTAWLMGTGASAEVAARSWGWITIVLLGMALAAVAATVSSEPLGRRAGAAGAFLVMCALALLYLTELVQIDDSFPGRLNTAFKFWFHAWAMLSVGGAALLALASERVLGRREARAGNLERGWSVQRIGRTVGWAGLLVTVATMITPPMAAVARSREGQGHGLSAIGYLERNDPGFFSALRWGRDELNPQEDIVAEAISESYDAGNRFSAFTGIPTLLGWPGHERQWHSDIREDARRAAIETLYTGDRPDQLDTVYDWGITHVVVGHPERAAYGVRVSQRFAGWPIVFSTPSLQVFQTPYTPDVFARLLYEDPVTGNAQ